MSTPRVGGGTPAAGRGDDDFEMQPATLVPDDVIDAILDDQPVEAAYTHLIGFADAIRDLGEGPAPRPSSALARLLEGGAPPPRALEPTQRLRALARRPHLPRTQRARRVARFGLGTTLAAASVIGAGAAGVLPAAASDTVRDAIEAISPVDFGHNGGDGHGSTTTTGPRPADGADGEGGKGQGNRPPEPGTPGDHRPGWSAAESEPPGQSGETGLTRADQTPAATHTPDTTPGQDGTSPSATAPGQVVKPEDTGTSTTSAPSTVPVSHGNQADDHTTGG